MGPRFRGKRLLQKLRLRSIRATACLFFPLAQIIVAGARARALGRRIGIESRGGNGGDAAILAHLQYFEPAAGTAEHPVLALELGRDALDRALGAERLAAADAAERLLLFQQARR